MKSSKQRHGSEPIRSKLVKMSSGSIQFRQSRNPHAGDHTARKLLTRKTFSPAPSSGLSAQPSSSQEEGRMHEVVRSSVQ